MFHLAYNSNGFLNRSLDETIDTLQHIGYEGVEIALGRNHLDSGYHSDQYVEKLLAKLADSRFKIVSLHTGAKHVNSEIDFEPSLISASPKDRRKKINYIIETLKLAEALNVKSITITSGIQQRDVDDRTAERYLHESIEQILQHTDGKVDLLMENEIGMYIATTDQLIRILNDYPRQLWATFDIGHAWCCHEDICESIDKLDGRIKHMHFEDILDRVHKHLMPGEGDIDFKEVVSKVVAGPYDGFCSVELYTYNHIPEEAARKSYDYLNALRGCCDNDC